jgi:hypothetical protein
VFFEDSTSNHSWIYTVFSFVHQQGLPLLFMLKGASIPPAQI